MKRAREAVWPESFSIPEMVVLESVGLVPNTSAPLPVSLVINDANSADVSILVDDTLLLKIVQSAEDKQPIAPAVAVLQLSVFELQERPVPLVIRVDGVV